MVFIVIFQMLPYEVETNMYLLDYWIFVFLFQANRS